MSATGGKSPFRGRVTLDLKLVPDDWAVAQGYADWTEEQPVKGRSDYWGRQGTGTMFRTIRWKPGVNPEEVVIHYLGGRKPPESFPAGSRAAAQWAYTGKGKGRTKEEQRATMAKLAAALISRERHDEEQTTRLLQEALTIAHAADQAEARETLVKVRRATRSIPENRMSEQNQKALQEAEQRAQSVGVSL